MTTELLGQCAEAFCETVADAGYRPMIYFNRNTGLKLYDLSSLTDYDFWYARYAQDGSFPYAYEIWQYTDSGRVSGIGGRVDANLQFIR